ncbi:MAG: AzlD domain-containing protein [Clostridia bacterium]|nr:AzlD domain-containing protein [Clostridia bacterium]
MTENFFIYLLVMAGVTYLVRMLPMVLVKKKITNTFIRSFLYYVPYAVLGVMTVPAIFYSTTYLVSAVAGFVVACILAYFERSLLVVAASACGTVLVCELIIKYAMCI